MGWFARLIWILFRDALLPALKVVSVAPACKGMKPTGISSFNSLFQWKKEIPNKRPIRSHPCARLFFRTQSNCGSIFRAVCWSQRVQRTALPIVFRVDWSGVRTRYVIKNTIKILWQLQASEAYNTSVHFDDLHTHVRKAVANLFGVSNIWHLRKEPSFHQNKSAKERGQMYKFVERVHYLQNDSG